MKTYLLIIVFSVLNFHLFAQMNGIEVFRMKKSRETMQVNKISFTTGGNSLENLYKFSAKKSVGFSLSSVKLFFPVKDASEKSKSGDINYRWTSFKAGTNLFALSQNSVANCLSFSTNARYATSRMSKWTGKRSVILLKTADFRELKSGSTSK